MYKVLIVEDHPLFSEGLAQLIETMPQYEVAGNVTNINDALSFLENTSINLVIVDLNLGDEDGLELIKIVRTKYPKIIILVLSMHDERFYSERALKAGANGYIMKEEAGAKVLEAIKTVMAGKVWLSENERLRLNDCLTGTGKGIAVGNDNFANINTLSNRQLQIFTLIGKGLGTLEISQKLNLSTKTIDTHKEHLKLKLHCNTSQELRQLAIEWVSR